VRRRWIVPALALVGACSKAPPKPVYQLIPVERRDIIVTARANGTVQPDTTVEVKTRASGEVLEIKAQTGELVKRGALLLRIDQRQPRNAVAQAQADLEVAKAQFANADAQKRRADALLASQSITQQEHDSAVLSYAGAKSAVVKAQVALENAKIQLEDTDVRAPITGTIIEQDVARGSVIASATSNVGGGTTLLKMADLSLVQVTTPVDETDIGKVQPGQRATVTVDAYPNRPFEGAVLKIEPQATVQQNVTMFPVRVRIDNRGGLLKPGMNAEVEIHIGERRNVPAVANAALRTARDVGSAAQVLGLDPRAVQQALSQQTETPQRPADSTTPQEVAAAGGEWFELPGGRTVQLPQGVTAAQVQAILAKRRSGDTPTPEEQALLRRVFQGGPGGGGGSAGASGGGAAGRTAGGGRRQSRGDPTGGGQWIVFVSEHGHPVPRRVRTGLTDLDYSEVLSGLALGDSVYILPSAGLVQSQQEFQRRVTNLTGGGLPGVQQRGGAASPPAPAQTPPSR
jgi:HlyD family secretion protein